MPTQGYPSSAGPGDHTRRAHAFLDRLLDPVSPAMVLSLTTAAADPTLRHAL
jgi:hypothetical protein